MRRVRFATKAAAIKGDHFNCSSDVDHPHVATVGQDSKVPNFKTAECMLSEVTAPAAGSERPHQRLKLVFVPLRVATIFEEQPVRSAVPTEAEARRQDTNTRI